MDYVKLNGRDILTDAEQIRNEMEKNSRTVFLYCGEGALYDYIHALCGEEKLYGELLYQWKVCYSNETLDVSFLVREAEQWVFRRHITSMTDLVEELDGKTPCRIVINTDSQKDRSFIVQQLIFLRYPLELADVFLWREAREIDEEIFFWGRADASLEGISENLKALFGFTAQGHDTKDSRMTPEILRKARETLRTCAELRWQMEFLQMELFQSRKVKLAIAASKKTGKSVIVNCFIGEEVAPTDVQLATPNNCIYRKSPDGKYHLQVDGDGEARTFSTREEIREAIGELFRAAQNDYEHGFALQDMRIGYRGTNSHSSSYTIYDTAGPDAAGTRHREAAFRAIKECDVALFAIDYGKYLTDSEEKYLNEVKDVFQSQQKFHSLIFALNKIDVRYTDPRSPKSIVEALDFIRTRLGALAEEYQDCVIFPTCALEYLCAVEAEDAGVTELRSPTDNVRKVKFAHKDVPALAWLHTHSENLEYYHGIEKFSYDIFKRDSGMPALMSYVFRMAMRAGARRKALEGKNAHDVAEKKTENSRTRNMKAGRQHMNHCKVNGENISDEIERIRKKLEENAEIVFLYVGEGAIHDYIHALYNGGKGLDNDLLYKFKLCYANKKLDITFLFQTADGWADGVHMDSMESLIEELDGKTPCRIIVNTDSREELSFIVQQLIFIQYPLETVDILLRQEERDADKVRRFQQRVDDLVEQCGASVANLGELEERVESEYPISPSKEDRLTDIQSALESCKEIQKNLEKARNLELKLAVAASKKTGKSVIVNCFIGEEVAPTDVQLATPNNCIYQKSPDNKYTLRMEGDGAARSFSTREEIQAAIEERFRAAQNDQEHGFALPDMRIGYRAAGNNFSSYTIYDTAGPDAAGTQHKEVALRAMKKCDVAVFAIDYGKYLTDSEETYLKEIKGIFQSQQKFHSLLFALNKIDVRYSDTKGVKSIVAAVDFIRTRLGALAEEYRDCIIFPTCSLEYFSALEAEEAGVTELCSPTDNVKKVKLAHKNVPALAWLHTHSENLEYYHGIEAFSYDVFKRDSGMPALMSYVSYVATSKARDEIVNHMVFEIEQQKQYLQTILNTVSNLEALIQADEEQIREIKRILEDYSSDIRHILKPEITQDDLNALREPSLLRDVYQGDVYEAKTNVDKSIRLACGRDTLLRLAYERTVGKMWSKLEPYQGEEMEKSKMHELMESLINKGEIQSLLRALYEERAQVLAHNALSQMQKLRDDINRIGGYRQELVHKRSEQTKEELEKEGVDLKLPPLPNFEFVASLPKPDTTRIALKELDIGMAWDDLFREEYSWGQFFAAFLIIPALFMNPKNAILNVNREQFRNICDEKFKVHFENALLKSDVAETVQKTMCDALVEGYVDRMIEELTQTFASMMQVQEASVELFSRIIDDRDKYKSRIDQQNKRKDNIRMIQDITSAFMETWGDVIGADGVTPT